jgi:hypothetical protein
MKSTFFSTCATFPKSRRTFRCDWPETYALIWQQCLKQTETTNIYQVPPLPHWEWWVHPRDNFWTPPRRCVEPSMHALPQPEQQKKINQDKTFFYIVKPSSAAPQCFGYAFTESRIRSWSRLFGEAGSRIRTQIPAFWGDQKIQKRKSF